MPVYKLTYFNLTALGEPIRLILSYGDIKFEDIRIERADWPKLKASMPMGQMPVLEIDGKRIYQSSSICRYLAKQTGLDGSTDFENFEIDSIVDTINDFRMRISSAADEENLNIQAEKRKILNSETIPFYLNKLEEIAKANNGHLAANKLTWADMFFTGVREYLNHKANVDLTANHPHLRKVVDNVLANKNIQKYMDKRPKTDF